MGNCGNACQEETVDHRRQTKTIEGDVLIALHDHDRALAGEVQNTEYMQQKALRVAVVFDRGLLIIDARQRGTIECIQILLLKGIMGR